MVSAHLALHVDSALIDPLPSADQTRFHAFVDANVSSEVGRSDVEGVSWRADTKRHPAESAGLR